MISSNMASDRQQFNRALMKWQDLHQRQQYSSEQADGIVAVAYSRYSVEDITSQKVREVAVYYNEASYICATAESRGRQARLIRGLSRASMVDILRDRSVSDVVFIGHGSLSSIYLDDGTNYDWHDVALAATHLKKGVIIQRFCGNNLRKLSVPLGTFAVSEHSNVIATVDRTFDPDHDASDEELLRPTTDSSLASYDDAKARFPINKKWQSWVQNRPD